MKYQRFEDLPAWRAAIDLGVKTFALTATGCLRGYAGFQDQIERAAVSVSNNIAEGFERGTKQELITFLYYAKGSVGEVRSMVSLMDRLPNAQTPQIELTELRQLTETLSRQIGAWLESLKNSEAQDPRRLNENTRKQIQTAQRQDSYLKELRRFVDESRVEPQRPADDTSADE